MDEGQKRARKGLRSYSKERSGGRHYQKGAGRAATKAARRAVNREKLAEGLADAIEQAA